MATVQILDGKELFRRLADEIVKIAKASIKESGRFTLALSGGSTPIALYETLVESGFEKSVDLGKVFFFFGDERDVSPESEKSNYRLARDLLFKPLGVKSPNVIRWLTEIIDPREVADKYEQSIRRFFKLENGEFPRFDLVLLGIGDDCHTASLFPNTPAIRETKRIAVMNPVETLDANRLTLTFPAINNARNVIFTAVGEEKADAVREAIEEARNCARYPAGCVDPSNGKVVWMIDKAAASGLKKRRR